MSMRGAAVENNIAKETELEIVVTRADGYVENYGTVAQYKRADTVTGRIWRNICVRCRQYKNKMRFFFGRRWYRYQKGLSPWRLTST